jgi:hypothetical protein
LGRTLDLLRHLFRAAVTDDVPRLAVALEQYRAGGCDDAAGEWTACERDLGPHRLGPAIGATLARASVADLVPGDVYARLSSTYEQAVVHNEARLARYAEVVAALRTRDVEPLLLKSAALVALGIMHLGSPMSDVDAFIDPDDLGTAEDVLRSLGYAGRGVPASDWVDPTGALRLDLHSRFGLFAHREMQALIVTRETHSPGLGRVRVFEPNAFLVHLIVHLNEHRREFGYQLCWLLDVGRALRAWNAEVDWNVMSALVLWPHHRLWMLRTLRFFEKELDVELPQRLAAYTRDVSAPTLAEVLRTRRTQPWRFYRLRAWTDLARCVAGKQALRHRIVPHPGDALARAVDVYRERRDGRRLRLAGKLGPAPPPAAGLQEST